MKMPHLNNDTNYPYIESSSAYNQIKNSFDFNRWSANTKISVFNVPWSIGSNDVVKWRTENERNAYFDTLATKKYTTTTENNIEPNTAIELEIPYSSALTANYLMAEIPLTPNDNTPFSNSDEKNRIKRIFYFITDLQRSNGTVTEFVLSCDWFTTYQFRFNFENIMLERGHAPMKFTNVDEYLNDPINHTVGLLEPDITAREAEITKNSSFMPFGKGKVWALFAITCSLSQLNNFGTIKNNVWSNPNYSDTNNRYGYQYNVNNYEWGDDYSDLDVSSQMTHSVSGNTPNGYTIIGLPFTECEDFVNKIESSSPSFTRAIKAMFVLTDDMFTPANSVNFLNHNVYEIISNDVQKLYDVKFNKDDFNFPNEYKDLTKLYTFPYSIATITDNNGKSVNVKIENTGDIQMWRKVSIAYPYLNVTTFFSDINGSGKTEYEWVNLFGNKSNNWLANTSFEEFAMSFDIPTYSLFVNGEQNWLTDNWQTAFKTTRENALNAYHTAMRSANTALKNTNDSINTSNTNAANSANTSNANAANSANVSNQNTERSADLSKRTTQRNVDTSNTNVSISQSAGVKVTNDSNLLGVALQRWAADLQRRMAEADNNQAKSNAAGTIAQNLGGGVIKGMASGNLLGGVISGAIGAASAAYNTSTQIDTTNTKVEISIDNAASVLGETNGNNTNILTANQSAQRDTLKATNDLATNNTNDSTNVAITNTSESNRVSLQNTQRSNTTSLDNTHRSNSTSINNSTYSRNDSSEFSAKTTLEQTQRNALNSLNSAKNSAAIEICTYSGNNRNDEFKMRGVQISVKTMPLDSVHKIGDQFKRFGYTFNQWFNISTLTLMSIETYWKGKIYAQPNNAPLEAREQIENMFENGVTIWNNPEDIGVADIRKNKVMTNE